ncbi:hypothetical protein ACWCV9_01890 [Streptomyces sp. NPDC001606]
MTDVTAQTSDKAAPRAETGRTKTGRRRDGAVRTCLPAVVTGAGTGRQGPAAEDNIVRGED